MRKINLENDDISNKIAIFHNRLRAEGQRFEPVNVHHQATHFEWLFLLSAQKQLRPHISAASIFVPHFAFTLCAAAILRQLPFIDRSRGYI